MTTAIVCILILFALMGAPLFTVIIGAAMFGFHQSEIDLSVMAIELYRIADTPIMLALPLFTFAGSTLGESNISQRDNTSGSRTASPENTGVLAISSPNARLRGNGSR